MFPGGGGREGVCGEPANFLGGGAKYFFRGRNIHQVFVEVLLGNGPNMVSGSTVSNTELGEFFRAHSSSVSSFQPIICVLKQTHRVSRRTQRVCRRPRCVLSSETVLTKQYSARSLLTEIPLTQK